jgi:hypothetical protein
MAGKLPLVAYAALLLAACDGAPADAADAGPVTLVVGTSGDGTGAAGTFAPLVDGGTIDVHAGPQGGFHIYLTLRETGLAPGEPGAPSVACASGASSAEPCIDFVVRLADAAPGDTLDFFVPLHLGLTAAGAPGTWELSPPRLVQLDIGGLAEVDGRMLIVDTSIQDRDGRSAASSLTLRAVGVPLGEPPARDAGVVHGF